MEEIWKAIPGYEGYYEVSNTGRVKSITRTIIDKRGITHYIEEKEIYIRINNNGYKTVSLSKEGIRKMFLIHRLVAIAFLPNPDNLPIVNHKDENPANNNVENLEWCNYKYNSNYGTSKKRMSQSKQNKHTKKIWKCDCHTHERIELFNSIGDASENIKNDRNIGISAISKCANGHQKSAYGYYWEFDDLPSKNNR